MNRLQSEGKAREMKDFRTKEKFYGLVQGPHSGHPYSERRRQKVKKVIVIAIAQTHAMECYGVELCARIEWLSYCMP